MIELLLRVYIQTCAEYLGKGAEPVSYRVGESVGEVYAKKPISEIIAEFRKIEVGISNKTTPNDVRITVVNSFEAKIHGRKDKPSCNMSRGFFTAVWRNHLKSQFIKCEEIECSSKGDKHCLFIIKDIPPFPIAVGTIKEGHTPFEVAERTYKETPMGEFP